MSDNVIQTSPAGKGNPNQHKPKDTSAQREKILSERELLEYQRERQQASEREKTVEKPLGGDIQAEGMTEDGSERKKTGDEIKTNSSVKGEEIFVEEERSMSFE